MNKINEIDQIFSDCLDEVITGQATVADCLKRYPKAAAELEGLLLTSLDISKAASFTPPPGAKMRIRVALNERMAKLAQRKPFWRFGWANAVATFVMGLSLTGGGMAYAASGAMPGQMLYPLKLDLEQALVSIAFSTDTKVELLSELNDRRVDEIVFLVQRGDSQGIAEVTNRIESNLSAAAAAKGMSANEFATARANLPEDTQKSPDLTITGTEPAPPSATLPVTGGSSGTGDGTVPAVTQPPPMFGSATTVNTISIPSDGSTLDSTLGNHANDQLNALAGASSASNSPAVQAALDRAMAAIRNGYSALLS